MKFDTMLTATPGEIADSLDSASHRDGGWIIETGHDPFVLLGSIAHQAAGMRLGTAVAVAFARSPMVLAMIGHDLQALTSGNFVLGLGPQVRAHIERRFSMPYGKPVGRMREMIAALHAIWDAWQTGEPLKFSGEYYTHTLMTPTFTPEAHGFGRPPIFLGALGPRMTQLAGEVADGIVVHRMMSERYLHEVTIPHLEAGLAQRTRALTRPFEIVYPPFVAASADDETLNRQVDQLRKHIAFYASTPTYRPILDMHGLGGLADRLHPMSRSGDWDAMASLVDDAALEPFAVICRPGEVEAALTSRFGDSIDRAVLYPPGG